MASYADKVLAIRKKKLTTEQKIREFLEYVYRTGGLPELLDQRNYLGDYFQLPHAQAVRIYTEWLQDKSQGD